VEAAEIAYVVRADVLGADCSNTGIGVKRRKSFAMRSGMMPMLIADAVGRVRWLGRNHEQGCSYLKRTNLPMAY